MAELVARPAWAGEDLPTAWGGVTLAAAPETPMLWLAPDRGASEAVGAALGAALPAPGRSAELGDGGRLIWAGLDAWLLRGPAAGDLAARLSGLAAVADVSDGWVGLALTGNGAADVLARLVPIDLAPDALPPGAVARTELRHMMCLIERRGEGFEFLVMRSFAVAAIHEIVVAMRAVAARAALG